MASGRDKDKELALRKKQFTSLIRKATETGNMELQRVHLGHIFTALKNTSGEYVELAYQVALTQLSKKHAQIRLLALALIDTMFVRSKQVRKFAAKDMMKICELAIGHIKKKPLPPPHTHAELLRTKGLDLLKRWKDDFGREYPTIRSAYSFIHNTMKAQFPSIRDNEEQQREEERRRGNTRELWRIKHGIVVGQMEDNLSEIQACVQELRECLKLLVPQPGQLVPQEEDESSLEWSEDEGEETQANEEKEREKAGDEEDCGKLVELEVEKGYEDCIEDNTRKEGADFVGRTYNLEVSVPASLEIAQTAENAPVFATLRERRAQMERKWLTMVGEWSDVLSRVEMPQTEMVEVNRKLRVVIELNTELRDAKAKCDEILGPFHSTRPGEAGDNDDEWDEPIGATNASLAECVGHEEIEPKKLKRNERTISVSSNSIRGAKPAAPAVVIDGIEMSISGKSREELLAIAPVRDVTSLDLAGDDYVPNMNAGLEYNHHFSGFKTEETNVSKDKAPKHLFCPTRAIRTELPRVERPCRAPLRNKPGQLCNRYDREVCPYHGPIVERDEVGVPVRQVAAEAPKVELAPARIRVPDSNPRVVPNNIEEITPAALPSSPDPETPAPTPEEILREEAREQLLQGEARRSMEENEKSVDRKRKRAPRRRRENCSNLIPIEKPKQSSFSRLSKVIRKREKVSTGVDQYRERYEREDKFYNSWNFR